jgi:hypothetical protein
VLLLPAKTRQPPVQVSSAPAQVPAVEKKVPLSASDRRQIGALIDRFVPTAVGRRDVVASYDLVTPALRSGMSRSEWASGSIPVTPYAASGKTFAWTVSYSLRNQAALVLVLHPESGAKTGGMSADVVVKRIGRAWLVDSFVPEAIFGNHRVVGTHDFGAGTPSGQSSKARLGAAWLALPLAFVALLIGLPFFIVTRGWLRHRRAERAYRATR